MYGTLANKDSELNGQYIVFSPGSTQPPTRTYSSRPEAIKCAVLMGNKYPGQQFGVFKCVGVAKQTDVKYEDFEPGFPKPKGVAK